MARKNHTARQRGDIAGLRRDPSGRPADAPAGLPGPAVDLVCLHCRQPVYPGYGTSDDGTDFIHFDCLRDHQGRR